MQELSARTSEDTKSPLLVIAVAGRVGSGTSFVREELVLGLQRYRYEALTLRVSRIVLDQAYASLFRTDESLPDEPFERALELQERGDRLRKDFGRNAVARTLATNVIQPKLSDSLKERQAFIIDSLKNPAEVEFLRSVFGDAFYLVGVVAADGRRRDRLCQRKKFTESQYARLSNLDSGSRESWGQHAVKTVVGADYFLVNNFDSREGLEREAQRFLRLVFGSRIDTPRRDEKGMSAAFEASLGSACLSRQVGAAILDQQGIVLSTGCNDVPRFGGGLYTSDTAQDKRCWSFGAKCYNDEEKAKISDEICQLLDETLGDAGASSQEDTGGVLASNLLDRFRDRLRTSSRIQELIEFSRAVHAEMDAIVAVARKGATSLIGSTLYCTTFPCHNCAKHIVASGIERVVYLEPYEKSLARRLHPDSISDPLNEESSGFRLDIALFGGVAWKRFQMFFGKSESRKENGIYIDKDRSVGSLLPRGAQDAKLLEFRLKNLADEVLAEDEDKGDADGAQST